MNTATIAPPASNFGIQGDAPAPPAPVIAGKPVALAEAPAPGWSMRELGQYRALQVHQRGNDWALDVLFLHHVEGDADPIQRQIRQRVDAIRQELGERVAQTAGDSKTCKDFQAALAELKRHETDAAAHGRTLERLRAQRQAEALAEKPSAVKLSKLDHEIGEADGSKRQADGLVSTMQPIVSERRKSALREVEQVAEKEFARLVGELMEVRKTAMAALAAAAGGPLLELLVCDQTQKNVVMGTKAPAVAAAMTSLQAPPA